MTDASIPDEDYEEDVVELHMKSGATIVIALDGSRDHLIAHWHRVKDGDHLYDPYGRYVDPKDNIEYEVDLREVEFIAYGTPTDLKAARALTGSAE